MKVSIAQTHERKASFVVWIIENLRFNSIPKINDRKDV